jgi:hypothetical protein
VFDANTHSEAGVRTQAFEKHFDRGQEAQGGRLILSSQKAVKSPRLSIASGVRMTGAID